MKRLIGLPLVLATAACVAPQSEGELQHGDVIPGRYIVQLDRSAMPQGFAAGDELSVVDLANELTSVATFERDFVYASALQGFVAITSEDEAARLALDPRVISIEPDRFVILGHDVEATGKPAPAPKPQATPWGVARVGGAGDGSGKTAWVIDSGVDYGHPDINVDTGRSRTFLGGNTTPEDQNGHGSHVAGTIAGRNDGLGVIGVAADANVVSVRVLDRRGSGSYSGVIAGVDYVKAAGVAGDVANMSLGGPVSAALDAAVLAASENVKFVLAAGNESDDANNHSPARVNGPNVYTISASDSLDRFASFSNYNSSIVDYAEPGVSIYSTYKSGGYATLSGTSMAAPHAAGILLLGNIQNGGSIVSGDPDGTPDTIGVR